MKCEMCGFEQTPLNLLKWTADFPPFSPQMKGHSFCNSCYSLLKDENYTYIFDDNEKIMKTKRYTVGL